MFRPPEAFFEVKPAVKNGGWSVAPAEQYKPVWHSDIEKKKAFGALLGKGHKPIDAGMIAFNDDLSGSMWATQNWLRDPVVMDARETVENAVNLLDKDQLSVKLLRIADEKINGNFAHEVKDRTALLKLYAEIQGMMPKTGVDLSKNSFVNNEMKIVFVEAEPEKEQTKTIEHIETEVHDLENALKIDLKLVG